MKYSIELDDKTKTGADLLEIARDLSKRYKSVIVRKLDEGNEDAAIGRMIEKGVKSGLADKNTVLKKLKI